MQSDAELVEAVLGGEREAFAILVQRYERAVLGTALAILRDPDAAHDVVQETFLVAYQKMGSLRDGGQLAHWLLTIGRRRAARAARRRAGRRQAPLPFDLSIGGDDGRANETAEELLKALGRLPVRERRFVQLRYFDGLSVQEIADATGRPVGTITKCLSRARDRLRRHLTARGKADGGSG